MKLDLTSFAFGFAINGSNGNRNWATAPGQGYLHKINQSDSINEILKGLIYCSVPLDRVQTKIGKGGKVYKGTDLESGIVTGSVFNKVYVNGNLVPDCKVIIVLTKDTTPSHEGRLRLKYSPHNAILNEQGDVTLSNADQIEKIRKEEVRRMIYLRYVCCYSWPLIKVKLNTDKTAENIRSTVNYYVQHYF